jgi:flagellar basal-body rod protein FlgC
VKLNSIDTDESDFTRVYQPGHPAADKDGYVLKPNVNGLVESADMKAAQRSYEANLNAIEAAKSLTMRTIDLLK